MSHTETLQESKTAKDCGKRYSRKHVMSTITAVKPQISTCERNEREYGLQTSSQDISNNILCVQRTHNT